MKYSLSTAESLCLTSNRRRCSSDHHSSTCLLATSRQQPWQHVHVVNLPTSTLSVAAHRHCSALRISRMRKSPAHIFSTFLGCIAIAIAVYAAVLEDCHSICTCCTNCSSAVVLVQRATANDFGKQVIASHAFNEHEPSGSACNRRDDRHACTSWCAASCDCMPAHPGATAIMSAWRHVAAECISACHSIFRPHVKRVLHLACRVRSRLPRHQGGQERSSSVPVRAACACRCLRDVQSSQKLSLDSLRGFCGLDQAERRDLLSPVRLPRLLTSSSNGRSAQGSRNHGHDRLRA